MEQGGPKGAGARLFSGSGPVSSFVLEHQLALLRTILPKARGASLLEVNCGEGHYMPLYNSLGFDVYAAEPDAALRAKAISASRGMDVYAASAEHLPYDDNSLDWAVFHLRNEDAEKCAGELLRVAGRGFVLTFWNSASLASLCWKISGKSRAWPYAPRAALGVWRMLRELKMGRPLCRSTLFCPVSAWRNDSPAASWNTMFGKSLLGAWCAIRIDLGIRATGTPLGLRIRSGIQKTMPAMEYSQKNISGCKKDVTDP